MPNFIILDNIFFGFWQVLGDFFVFWLAFALMLAIFFAIFDLMIPR